MPTMIAPAGPVSAPPIPPQLTARDRCDRCGAQAYVAVSLQAEDLLFCGHDYAKHEAKLSEIAVSVRDERARLLDSYNDVKATELDS